METDTLMTEGDKPAEPAPMKTYTPPSYKDTMFYGIPPERIAAALADFSSLSPRVQVTQPTPELALVEMSKHVIDQSRLLTEALTTVKSTGQASEERMAALEVTLAGLAAKIDALQAAPSPQAKPKTEETAKAPPATPKKGAAATEDELKEPVDSVDDYEEIVEPEKPAPKLSRSGKVRTRTWI